LIDFYISTPVETILHSFIKNVDRLGSQPCFRYKEEGGWRDLSWQEVERQLFAIASGLSALGVKKGDAVAIFSATRYEWVLCDLAILSLGAITVPIYQSNTAEQAAFILQDSQSKVVFVENQKLLERVRLKLPEIPAVLFTAGSPGDSRVKTLNEWTSSPGGDRPPLNQVRSSDIATYVYTSGTTGNPKGVILTHGNIIAGVEACLKLFEIPGGEVSLLFLPLAHILGREIEFYQLHQGFIHAFAEGIEKVGENIAETRPYFFVAVPRIFEKVYERILAQVEAGSPLKKAIFSWASAVGREASRHLQKGEKVPTGLRLRRAVADLLVFGKLKRRLGGHLQFAVSGGAPLSREIAEFFHAAGILILEGYGLTETMAAINCNTPACFRFGSVGRPVDRGEEKIAPDGEIWVRGPMLFQGYFKRPEATREVLTSDGWFKTGDVGEIDTDGYLRITDRKKDIIVTAAGKNIAPQNIENLLKTVPFISQVMVHGDRQKYLSALITLNREQIEDFARSEGISFGDYRELVKHPRVYSHVKKAVDEKNRQLASFETIKRFAILDSDFTQETGELTPTLKVKRKVVTEKYKEILSGLYQEKGGGDYA